MTSLLPDAIATEMRRLRIRILSAEHRGDWKVADEARDELKELHELSARREYVGFRNKPHGEPAPNPAGAHHV